jgi:hypothetical protein
MYANLDIQGFIKAVIIAADRGLARIGRDSAGRVDYICIWNLSTPSCIDFEFVIGPGYKWVEDRPVMLRGFEYLILHKRGVTRKHKIKSYGSSQ